MSLVEGTLGSIRVMRERGDAPLSQGVCRVCQDDSPLEWPFTIALKLSPQGTLAKDICIVAAARIVCIDVVEVAVRTTNGQNIDRLLMVSINVGALVFLGRLDQNMAAIHAASHLGKPSQFKELLLDLRTVFRPIHNFVLEGEDGIGHSMDYSVDGVGGRASRIS